MKDLFLFMFGMSIGIFIMVMQGCSSLVMRNGDCEVAYTRTFGEVSGLAGTACGGSAKVDSAKVDSKGIEAATSPIGSVGLGVATSGAAKAIAPVLPALVK